MRCVVGLGNPGKQYEATRHNAGFLVLERLVRQWNLGPPRTRCRGLVWTGSQRGRSLLLLAPQTFMNLSGQAVGDLAGFYKIAPADILIVLDDMALPTGRLRARSDGSGGGHNGLTDIIRALGTDAVPRLRIGIGRPTGPMDQVDYVLGRFGPDERPLIEQATARAAEAVEDWLVNGITYVMDRYNQDSSGADESPRNGKG